MPNSLVTTHVIKYYSESKGGPAVYPQGVSPLEAIEVSRGYPSSEITEIVLDVSTNPPTVVSSEVLE